MKFRVRFEEEITTNEAVETCFLRLQGKIWSIQEKNECNEKEANVPG